MCSQGRSYDISNSDMFCDDSDVDEELKDVDLYAEALVEIDVLGDSRGNQEDPDEARNLPSPENLSVPPSPTFTTNPDSVDIKALKEKLRNATLKDVFYEAFPSSSMTWIDSIEIRQPYLKDLVSQYICLMVPEVDPKTNTEEYFIETLNNVTVATDLWILLRKTRNGIIQSAIPTLFRAPNYNYSAMERFVESLELDLMAAMKENPDAKYGWIRSIFCSNNVNKAYFQDLVNIASEFQSENKGDRLNHLLRIIELLIETKRYWFDEQNDELTAIDASEMLLSGIS